MLQSECYCVICNTLGKHLLSKKVAEIQLLTNNLCQHCLLALDL
jgi:hypothetical protein